VKVNVADPKLPADKRYEKHVELELEVGVGVTVGVGVIVGVTLIVGVGVGVGGGQLPPKQYNPTDTFKLTTFVGFHPQT
jgi:hypothetical protein